MEHFGGKSASGASMSKYDMEVEEKTSEEEIADAKDHSNGTSDMSIQE